MSKERRSFEQERGPKRVGKLKTEIEEKDQLINGTAPMGDRLGAGMGGLCK